MFCKITEPPMNVGIAFPTSSDSHGALALVKLLSPLCLHLTPATGLAVIKSLCPFIQQRQAWNFFQKKLWFKN